MSNIALLRNKDFEAALLKEKQPEVTFPSTGPEFYDYECELKAVWKLWHKDQKK